MDNVKNCVNKGFKTSITLSWCMLNHQGMEIPQSRCCTYKGECYACLAPVNLERSVSFSLNHAHDDSGGLRHRVIKVRRGVRVEDVWVLRMTLKCSSSQANLSPNLHLADIFGNTVGRNWTCVWNVTMLTNSWLWPERSLSSDLVAVACFWSMTPVATVV